MITISPNLRLQTIVQEDQHQLFLLMQRIYPSAYAHYWKDDCSWYLNKIYSKEALYSDLSKPDEHYYFVRFNENIIGIFKLAYNQTYHFEPRLAAFKVQRLYLDPLIQGKGIGKQLMRYAEEKARLTSHDLIWLDAMDTHTQAQQFYTSLGYSKKEKQYLNFDLLRDEHRSMWYMQKML